MTRLRPGWYRLPRPDPGTPLRIHHGRCDLVAWADGDEVHALTAWCPHLGADLADGRVERGELVCALHGWAWADDGANRGTGVGPATDAVRATAVPVGRGPSGPLVWIADGRPLTADHDPVDLAALLPRPPDGTPSARVDATLPLEDMDPAMVIENGFDAGHIPAVHGRPPPEIGPVAFRGDLATVEHRDPSTGTTAGFTAYRGSQVLVRLTTRRPGLVLWVLGAVTVGTPPRFAVRYEAHGPGAAPLVRRFAREHRRELERDLALFARQRPERGRHWGPRDGTLRAYRAWLDGFS